MTKPDYAHRRTDADLAKLERRIAEVYREARDDLDRIVTDYFEKFAARDAEQKKRMEDGEITEQYYRQWRLNQLGRGERYIAMRDKVAQRMTDANAVARSYVQDATPGIYSLNRNYAAYTIERVSGRADFTLWDESTVRRMIVEQPDVMPYYSPTKALNRGIDLEYGKKQITKVTTSAILQGKSVKGIADDLQTRVTDMNRTSAIRAARTAVTAAQNAGRQDSYVAASKMGIKITREWVAAKDNRTRHNHAMADGQQVGVEEPFVVGGEKMMFPGDDSMGASGWNIYNCRCRVYSSSDRQFEAEPHMMRVRDPETGRNVVVEKETYAQWAARKEAENKTAWDVYMKKGKNLSSDQKQFEEYKALLGKKVPSSLAAFQDLKYNDPEKWAELKDRARYKRRVPEATAKD